MHLSICKFTQTFRGVLEELPNFLKLDNDRQNSTKSKLTGNPKPCYNEKIHPDKFIITMCLFSPNGNTPSKKDVSASLQKRPFSLYQMRKCRYCLEFASLCCFFYGYSNCYGCTNHRVVAHYNAAILCIFLLF